MDLFIKMAFMPIVFRPETEKRHRPHSSCCDIGTVPVVLQVTSTSSSAASLVELAPMETKLSDQLIDTGNVLHTSQFVH